MALYKFRNASERSLEILDKGEIWFAGLPTLNDPLEGHIQFETPNREEYVKWYIDFLQRLKGKPLSIDDALKYYKVLMEDDYQYEQLLKIVEESETGYNDDEEDQPAVLSCSHDDSFSPIDNPLMWAYYADEFKGFAIRFDEKKFFKSLNDLNSTTFFSNKVNYQDKPKQISFYEHLETHLTRDMSKEIGFSDALITKSSWWKHEQEHRFLCQTQGAYRFDINAVTAIYFGSRTSDCYKKKVLQILKRKNHAVDIYDISPRNYAIATKKIS
ncbi:hypothetical protein C1S99_25570 [Vibrio parahaemolyticus]|uniref:DUF2971 domain-containing protein n=1 Tax=Vibrio parahaemolyticus TaxID=670 RepID=UPI000C86920B|nr:DUF2971 domain-containing protein [Vibrio parahaemolyticus]EJB8691703.1 DUF2971 domain-containing protein [Vibrio parahaemolyticus]PMS39153.1 hypothetical protein C1T12_25645 [Vibrio parahaemolyticus]PMS57342.1 hypothetical protein C1S91_26165 [Vibrio parahaemolyticus]PMS65251.1 hypothetical protein C1S96_25920 [Vibrio parahaemolyticus]PMS70508.1 hypothetical protein C1T10_25630 [Vibrio parahaemolyticus]